jgi:hypothetical protein
METLRLRTLQQPSATQLQLESLLLSLRLPPDGADRLIDRTELPAVFQRIVIRGARDGIAWAAWRQSFDVHFCSAELALALSREHGKPSLRLSIYDQGGTISEIATWTEMSHDEWSKHSH